MENRYGFIRDKLEIKILILFVLSRLTEPVDFETLTDLCMCDDAISYFDYSDCVNELISTDHIYFDGQKYVITDKGRKNGSVTETGIPYTVRLKAEKATSMINARLARDSLISTGKEIKHGGGYLVRLCLSDGSCDIISMELYAANSKQAEDIETGFRKHAEEIYNSIINKLFD